MDHILALWGSLGVRNDLGQGEVGVWRLGRGEPASSGVPTPPQDTQEAEADQEGEWGPGPKRSFTTRRFWEEFLISSVVPDTPPTHPEPCQHGTRCLLGDTAGLCRQLLRQPWPGEQEGEGMGGSTQGIAFLPLPPQGAQSACRARHHQHNIKSSKPTSACRHKRMECRPTTGTGTSLFTVAKGHRPTKCLPREEQIHPAW